MKKIYSGILLTAILFFSYMQTVFAEEFNFNLPYVEGSECWATPPQSMFYLASHFSVLFPLSLFIAIILLNFIYLKLRKKDTAKIKPMLNLAKLGFLSLILSYSAVTQITPLIQTNQCGTTSIQLFFLIIDVMKNNNLSLILTTLSVLSLLIFIYYLIRTIKASYNDKIKK